MARRRYQRGSLFLRGKNNPVWVGRWLEDEKGEDGKTIRIHRSVVLCTKREQSQREARRLLDEHLNRSQVNSPTYRPNLTCSFEEFVVKWQASVLTQHKPSTSSAIRSQIKVRLTPFFGSDTLREIDTARLQQFVSTTVASPKTMRNLIITMRMIWNTAKAWGYVAHDPFQGIVLPRGRKAEVRCFTLDEVQRIISAADEPYRTAYMVLAETGIRAGELCGLRREDVDAVRGIVRVRQSVWHGKVGNPKSAAGVRTFAISAHLQQRFLDMEQRRIDSMPFLFCSSTGSPWDANLVVKRKLKPLLDRLGITRAGFHAFRHCNATLLDGMGAAMKSRMARLGHVDAATTIGYTHAIDAEDRRIAAELGRVLCSPLPKSEAAIAATN